MEFAMTTRFDAFLGNSSRPYCFPLASRMDRIPTELLKTYILVPALDTLLQQRYSHHGNNQEVHRWHV